MITMIISFLLGGVSFFFLRNPNDNPWLFSLALLLIIFFIFYFAFKSYQNYKKSKINSLDIKIKKEELRNIKGDKNE